MGRRTPRGYWPVHVLVLALGLATTALVSEQGDWEPVGLFAVLLALGVASALVPVRVGVVTFTPTELPSIALAATLLGPAPAVAIALADTLADAARRRTPLGRAVENLTAFTLFPLAGALIFEATADALDLEAGEWGFALLVVGLYGVMTVLTFTITAIQFRLEDGVPFRLSVRESLLPTLPLECIAASLTGLVTIGYGEMGVAAVVGVLPFMLLATHLLRELLNSRERAKEIAALADGRRKLIAKALDAEDRARRELAQTLHDNPIQLLLAAQQEMDAARTGDRDALARIDGSVHSALTQLRSTTFDLHPAVLRHAGLASALRTLVQYHAERASFDADVQVDIDGAVTDARAELLFALAHELLVNAAKHAAASHVRASIRHEYGRIELEVRDDGRGFEPATRTAAILDGHIGLASVAERAEEAGGSFTLESAPGAGTRVLVDLPA
jgi:signal transduction histidine kinase